MHAQAALEPRVRGDKVPAQNLLFVLDDPSRRNQFCARIPSTFEAMDAPDILAPPWRRAGRL
jgi:hypothetical protein